MIIFDIASGVCSHALGPWTVIEVKLLICDLVSSTSIAFLSGGYGVLL